ncbi:hypothetical protein OIU77_028051 [Salix suchowensis]|uniref:Uncharacterized protein n=1 Tax=Salix suchowensis TaxID=1278906 RepID=A0ABQ9BIJ3_9ROSI|nr:hypothetical protein OIU77_028051 [Salix suchowensis]
MNKVEIDSKPPIVGDQKWDFMDLFLQYANSTWEDLLNCLQCSKLLPVYNAMIIPFPSYSPTGFHHFRFLCDYCCICCVMIVLVDSILCLVGVQSPSVLLTADFVMLCRFEQQHAKEAQFRGVLAALAPVRAGSLTL